MTEQDHLDLELQDLLDERLGPSERVRVQAHVDACDRCRADLDALRRGREFARSGVLQHELPLDLRAAIERELDRKPVAEGRGGIGRRRVLVYGLGAAAAGLLAALYLRRGHDLPAEVIETFKASNTGQRALDLATTDPATLERLFGARLDFRVRVFDLGMMNYRLVGGRVDRLADHPTALYAYVGPENRRLECQMYRGTVSELPEPSERRTANGFTFLIYSRPGHTAVFWSEGEIVCVLVSDMPAEDTISLAIAKAMKA